MKWRSRNPYRDGVGRGLALLFSFVLIAQSLDSILHGAGSYTNYWGGIVFAPLALVLGVVFGALSLFYWPSSKKRGRRKKKAKLKGRAARKARQAERYRAPIDDYDRPWRGGW